MLDHDQTDRLMLTLKKAHALSLVHIGETAAVMRETEAPEALDALAGMLVDLIEQCQQILQEGQDHE